MSFGFSISDIPTLLRWLGRTISLLRGEATSGYEYYKETYSQLNGLALCIKDLVRKLENKSRGLFSHEIRLIDKLLMRFSTKIQELQPYLGRERKKRNFRSIIEAIR
ncbi:hypothetical protein F5Y16DRAFT_215766 [Xylariaceae sp. FL0255]|nr:hypothetical protein F5Y16DRAFT_215766 [Xylariaceae sp. FL0255]